MRGGRPDAEVVSGMIQMLAHRGPDSQGVIVEENAALANRRLSIIDIAGGHQPMHSAGLWITFNGEIFNYVELRKTLEQRGHHFATRSDTEVILGLYQEYGESCVHQLNGQWAFAIWDGAKGRLFLSRDRLGIRPLFYTISDGAFIFGSEIKAIFAHPAVSRELDLNGLDQVFTFWHTVPPQTVFHGIRELPPAHSLTLEQGEIRVQRYWDFDYDSVGHSVADADANAGAFAEQLMDLLADATRIRLRCDVPVGAYLSGGLDSSTIVALISRLSNAPPRTFSIAFEDREFDESAYQHEVVRHLGTVHTEVRCCAADIAENLPRVVWHTEQPVLRTAPVPLYLLSKLVRAEGFKVVLTGEGADEILGGYDIFKEAKIRRFIAAQPESSRRNLALRRLYPYLPHIQSQPDAYLKVFFRVRAQDLESPYFSHLPRWELTSQLKTFFASGAQHDHDPYSLTELPPAFRAWHSFSQAQYLEARYLLPGYILSSQGDRVTMANSVEGRFPFLDYRLVEFASKIPPRLRMKVLNEKYLLKRAAADLIPVSVQRRHKQPYRAPEGSCFFGGRGYAYVEDLLSEERLRQDGIFDPPAVRKLMGKFKAGRAISIKDNMAVVGILSTQLVVDQFLRHFPRAPHANQLREDTAVRC